MTGYAAIEGLNRVPDEGGFDCILKPFRPEDIVHAVRSALSKRRFLVENNPLKQQLKDRILQLENEFEERTRQLGESQIKYKLIVEHSNDGKK